MYNQAGPKVVNLDSQESTDNFMAAASRFKGIGLTKGVDQNKRTDQTKQHNSLDRILATQRVPADRTGLGYPSESNSDWDAPEQQPSGTSSSLAPGVPYKTKDGWHCPPILPGLLKKSVETSMAFSESQQVGPNAQSLPDDWDDTWDPVPASKMGNSTSTAELQKNNSGFDQKPKLATGTNRLTIPVSGDWDEVPANSVSAGYVGMTANSPCKSQGAPLKRYLPPHLRQKFVSAGAKPEPPAPKLVNSTTRENTSAAPVKASKLVSAPVNLGPPTPKAVVGGPSGHDSSALLPLKVENISPDLTTYSIPHPDKNFRGSEASLPDTVSTIAISDTGVEELADTRDVRNQIALERDVCLDNRGKFFQTNWRKHFVGQHDDNYFETNAYLKPFITIWLDGIPEVVKPRFLKNDVPQHWKSDVDTNTGLLVEPVHFPDTIIGDNSALTGEEDWRRRNYSSNLLIHRRFGDLHKYRRRRGHKNVERQLAYKPGKVEPYVKPEPQPEPAEEDYLMALHDPGVPKIPAFLRPAEIVDMEAVSLIYEAEMKSGFQVIDSEPPSAEDWERVFQTTRELSMPFIVAVCGSARRCGLKEGNLQWSDAPQVPYNEHEAASRELFKGQILGFAYASVWQPGVAGSGQGTSCYTARLHVWVDRRHRRNKLGLGLIDRLLACMSPEHNPRTGIDFVDIHNNPIYHRLKDDGDKQQEAIRNMPRKYFVVQIGYKCKHRPRWQLSQPDRYPQLKECAKDLVWVKKLLEDKLPFIQRNTFEAVHRSSKLREPKEEDGDKKVFWLDEFVWEYRCELGVPKSDDGY